MDGTTTVPRLFDADNHYWESSDAFTRHRDPAFAARGVQVEQIDGAPRYVVDGEVFEALPGPADVHLRPKPGAFMEYFAGKLSVEEFRAAFCEPPADHPEWYERAARLEVMDAQGVEATWLFPSQGVVVEPFLHHDMDAALESYRAFNRWLEEQWGFAYKDRIFAVPYLILADPAQVTRRARMVSRSRCPCRRHPPRRGGDRRRLPCAGGSDVRQVLGARAGVACRRVVARRC
jgi:hypothetical protein